MYVIKLSNNSCGEKVNVEMKSKRKLTSFHIIYYFIVIHQILMSVSIKSY